MVVRSSNISFRASFISYPVHNLLGALVFTDFLSVQNGGFCFFFSMRFVMCEIQLHLLLHFTMQHRFRQEETTEKMQASFRTGDDVETIKKPTNTGETKRYVSITDINFALSTFLCPSPEQTFPFMFSEQQWVGRIITAGRFPGPSSNIWSSFFLSGNAGNKNFLCHFRIAP